MRKIVIMTDTESVEVRETPSGVYAVTNDQGRGITGHNFLTLEEAAQAALEMALQAVVA